MAIVAVAKVGAFFENECGKKMDAFSRLHVREPKKWQSAGIERAVGGCDTDFCNLVIFRAEENCDFARAFEHDGRVTVVAHYVNAVLAVFQAADAAVIAVPVAVGAADAMIAGDFGDSVAKPSRRGDLIDPSGELI